ncbi:jg14281 [Pararge aegeria aegeria]|uniref:Jg14281 protein n=1 Tax=Pararge aegeria aegeria TaxID=348720 RepID=A0A8S4RRL9_9NEOP|nr:jg14281 [Pararge aegeria aegeria]
MAKIDVCRICLTEAVERDITQLSEELKGDKKSCWDILLFCLNIQVSPESKLTTKLCVKCFIKIISFHEFKTLALKNNEYLCCLQKRGDKKFNVFEMNNIKCEEMSNGHSDDGICDMEPLGKIEIKNEHNIEDVPSDDELLSVIKKIKDEYVTEACKENKESRPKTKSKGKKVRIRKRDKEPEQREKICEECGKTVVNLFEHMKLHLPAAERKRIQCKVCDKTFASYGARYRHNKIKHLGIKQHCDECGKVCYFRRQVHDKEKTHLCQICSKRFFKKYNLQVHLRSHSNEKPFECPDCGKHFSSTTIMKNHQMIHSDARNFACDLCDMAFKKPGYLRVHMISHTKEKRYSCTYCDMPFGRSDHRARHERTAHQRPFIQSQNNAPTQLNLQ